MSGLFLILLVWIFVIQLNLNEIKAELKKLRNKEQPPNHQIVKQEMIKSTPTRETPQPEITEKSFEERTLDNSDSYILKHKNDSKPFDFEKVFLGNIFNKIGALALIIAVGFFIKLISPMIIFTPVVKTVLGFLFGFVLIGISLKLHKDEMKNYAEVLMGTGFASLFITTYCAYGLLHTLNLPSALTIASVILLITYFTADKLKTTSMLSISLIGGYLTPLFINSDASLFGYLLFLNAVSLIFAYRNPERNVINIINLPITMIIALCHYHGSINVAYPLSLWLMYIIYDLVKINPDKFNIPLNWINYGVLTYFSVLLFKSNLHNLGYLLAATSLIYAGISYYLFKKNNSSFKHYLYSFILNTWLIVYFLATDIQSICIWSVEALILSFCSTKFKFDGLNKWVIAFYISIFTGILLARVNGNLCITEYYPTLFNPRLVIFGIPIITMALSAYTYKNAISENSKKLYDILKFGFITLIYLYITTEINAYITHDSNTLRFKEFTKTLTFSMIGLVYSLQAKRLYHFSKIAFFEFVSYLIGIISLLTLITTGYSYPLSSTSHYIPVLNIRFTAFILAISTTVIWAKWTKENLYKYLAVILGFILLHCESADYVKEYSNLNMNYIISLIWILYSGIITTIGIFKNKDFLKLSGIWLCILTIFRIFIYDLAKVDAMYKIIAFLALGIILMIISYFYTKNKNN